MADSRSNTRTTLLDAAEELFSRNGYGIVGVREIVERAGVNLAAVKYHFGGKGNLYRETVRRALERRDTAKAWGALRPQPESRKAAATMLVQFIHLFLKRLLMQTDDVVSSLILREAAEPTDAIDFVIQHFAQPHEETLVRVIAVLLPKASRRALSLHAQSILGQVLHYRTYRPFLERMTIGVLCDSGNLASIAEHIACVSLRGLGCSPRLIETARQSAAAQTSSMI